MGAAFCHHRGSGHDPEQTALTVVVTESDVIHQDDRVVADDILHLAVPARTKVWELTCTPAWTDDSTSATVSAVAKEGREALPRSWSLVNLARNCAQLRAIARKRFPPPA